MNGKAALIATCIALAGSASATAQSFPTKQLSMMMPYAAGGPGDTITRILAQGMSEPLQQQVIVENVAGAGGTIGSARVASAPPDGHSLLVMHIGQATNVALYPNLKYDTLKDFASIGLFGEVPMVIVGRKGFPADGFKAFVDYVKANKDKLTYAHAGIGSASQLCGLMFFSAIDTQVRQVPYRGTGPAMNDLLGGQVDFMCDQTVLTIPNVQSGMIKGYAATPGRRLPQLPDLTTASEAGLKGFELTIWYGLYATGGTPKPVIDKLNAALKTAVSSAMVKQKLGAIGFDIRPVETMTPEAHTAHVRAEIARWRPILEKAGVKGQ